MKKKTFIVQMLDSKNPSRTSFTQVEDALFYSNDTDASLVFIPHEDSFDFQTAKVVMYNRSDESLVERDAVVTTEDDRKVASYEMPDEIISHWGDWTAQPVFISGGEIYSGSIVPFSVFRYLMHERPPRLNEVVTITNFIQQSQALVDAMVQAEAQRVTQEQTRQNAEIDRIQAEIERSEKVSTAMTKSLLEINQENLLETATYLEGSAVNGTGVFTFNEFRVAVTNVRTGVWYMYWTSGELDQKYVHPSNPELIYKYMNMTETLSGNPLGQKFRFENFVGGNYKGKPYALVKFDYADPVIKLFITQAQSYDEAFLIESSVVPDIVSYDGQSFTANSLTPQLKLELDTEYSLPESKIGKFQIFDKELHSKPDEQMSWGDKEVKYGNASFKGVRIPIDGNRTYSVWRRNGNKKDRLGYGAIDILDANLKSLRKIEPVVDTHLIAGTYEGTDYYVINPTEGAKFIFFNSKSVGWEDIPDTDIVVVEGELIDCGIVNGYLSEWNDYIVYPAPDIIRLDKNITTLSQGVMNRTRSLLYQKNIVTFGDSITWYDGNPFYPATKEPSVIAKGYQSYVREATGAYVDNKGVNGGTMNVIYTSSVVPYDFSKIDIATFYVGMNDYRDSLTKSYGIVKPIGSSFDDSFAGALQKSIEHILSVKNDCTIGLIISHKGWYIPSANRPDMTGEIANIVFEISELYKLPVLDLYHNSGIDHITESSLVTDTTTNFRFHLTNKGYERIGRMVTDFVQSI